MHLLILAGFVLVLWLPEPFTPIAWVRGPWALAAAAALPLLPLAIGSLTTRSVRHALDRHPDRPRRAQDRFLRAELLLQAAIAAGFLALIQLTEWPVWVHQRWHLQGLFGLGRLTLISPLLLAVILGWVAHYPADRALRDVALHARLMAGLPARPTWSLSRYLNFKIRHHMLLILIPMVIIVIAYDLTREYAPAINRWSGRLLGTQPVFWAHEAVLMAVVGLVFLLSPLMLRWVWLTHPLPRGPLRTRLQALCARIRLRFRDVLVWQSDGLVINAAVAGLIPRLRYVFLSDGLIETMDDRRIEAVFSHEAGHIKHHHIFFFVAYSTFVLLAVSIALISLDARGWLAFPDQAKELLGGGALLLIWLVGFAWLSHLFEKQADVFAVRCLTRTTDACPGPCHYHHAPADAPPATICRQAARDFARALLRIAELNGIALEARSVRHPSIAARVRFLEDLAASPPLAARFHRRTRTIQAAVTLLAAAAIAAAAVLYWPAPLAPRQPLPLHTPDPDTITTARLSPPDAQRATISAATAEPLTPSGESLP